MSFFGIGESTSDEYDGERQLSVRRSPTTHRVMSSQLAIPRRLLSSRAAYASPTRNIIAGNRSRFDELLTQKCIGCVDNEVYRMS